MGKGALVVLLLPNLPQMVIGFYGTMKAGSVAVLVPPIIEPDEMPRAKGMVVRAGHVPHRSNAGEFNEIVLEFLRNLPS